MYVSMYKYFTYVNTARVQLTVLFLMLNHYY